MSNSPVLWLPKSPTPVPTTDEEGKPRILTPAEHHQKEQFRRWNAKRMEHPGRNSGKPHGTWVTDMGERKQSIFLCRKCRHKFNPRQYNYYRTREFRVLGRCDACKQHENNGTFFIHESLIGRNSGQCWTAR